MNKFILFLITLSGIYIPIFGITVSLGELMIFILLPIWSRKARYIRANLNIQVLFIVLISLLSFRGLISLVLDSNFFALNHFINLVRVAGSVFMGFIVFNLFHNKKEYLTQSLKQILNIHLIALFLDSINLLPLQWSDNVTSFGWNNYERPSGLFGEPSFYAIFILTISFILRNLNSLSVFYRYAVILSLLVSTSLSGLIAGILLILPRRIKIKSIVQLSAALFFIGIVIISNPVFNERYVSRLSNILSDGSILNRSVGSYLTITETLKNRPFLGYGLGSRNHSNFYSKHQGELFTPFLTESEIECLLANTCDPSILYSTTTVFANLLLSGGIILLIIYFLIYYNLFLKFPDYRSKIFFIILPFMFGQPFESYLIILGIMTYSIYNYENNRSISI